MKRFVKRPSPAMAVAFLALVVALGGTALGRDAGPAREMAVSGSVGNVKLVKTQFVISNDDVGSTEANCPAGTKIFSGGYAMTGQHSRIIYAGPARVSNAYIVGAYMPPVNINAGITAETSRITVVGYCAPVGKPIVMR